MRYERAVALQMQLVAGRPEDKARTAELERLQQRLKETAP